MGKRFYKSEGDGYYRGLVPRMVVMPPDVINEDGPLPGENVSSEGIVYDSEQGVILDGKVNGVT